MEYIIGVPRGVVLLLGTTVGLTNLVIMQDGLLCTRSDACVSQIKTSHTCILIRRHTRLDCPTPTPLHASYGASLQGTKAWSMPVLGACAALSSIPLDVYKCGLHISVADDKVTDGKVRSTTCGGRPVRSDQPRQVQSTLLRKQRYSCYSRHSSAHIAQ
jgi:hypothetical protein